MFGLEKRLVWWLNHYNTSFFSRIGRRVKQITLLRLCVPLLHNEDWKKRWNRVNSVYFVLFCFFKAYTRRVATEWHEIFLRSFIFHFTQAGGNSMREKTVYVLSFHNLLNLDQKNMILTFYYLFSILGEFTYSYIGMDVQ